MRKIFIFSLAMAFLLTSIGVSPILAQSDTLNGQVVKLEGQSTLYYIGLDGRRYVFPNENTFRSWFVDFSTVEEISLAELSQYPLAGNVNYRPGIQLIKIQSDPKVYAVGNNGVLRWIKTEKLAERLYGQAWNQIIDDLSAAFFATYTIGDDIDDNDDFNPDNEISGSTTIDDTTQKIKDRIKELRKELKDLKKQVRSLANSEKKVAVCHKGKTIVISKSALPAHLAHGDNTGRCGDDDDEDDNDNAAPIITNINSATSTSTATITWLTNELSDSRIEYATSTLSAATSTLKKSKSNNVTSHSIELTGLTPNTTYYYIVMSEDQSDNLATSTEKTFTTGAPDITAPIISNINKTVSTSTATVTWLTNEPSDSRVEYATSTVSTANPVLAQTNTTSVISHSIMLAGLTPNTTYHFIVKSKDSSNNTASSTNQTFTTTSLADTTAPIISSINVATSTAAATISWLTNESSDSSVEYATSTLATATSIFSLNQAALVTNHSLNLSGLTASTSYYFIVKSKDSSNNTASSAQQIFVLP